MTNDLSPSDRASTATAMLADAQAQLYRARFNLALNIGDSRAEQDLLKTIAQLERGIANAKALFAADLNYKPETAAPAV